ncbi:hypothetical protein AC1031_002760 [Aphanomyces cochlioides]|nr:hypothetical protein AC1031_002760 [Aphanomyces cochlioides]
MGQSVSCCWGSEDLEPAKKRHVDVPSTPSMSGSIFFESLAEHEVYGDVEYSDSSFVESIVRTKRRTSTADSINTKLQTSHSRALDYVVTTPSLKSSQRPPTLSYAEDADDEGPIYPSTASEGTDDTLEEPSVDTSNILEKSSESEDNNNEAPEVQNSVPNQDSMDNNQAGETDETASYSVHVKRFFPIEGKFEFTVTIFDAKHQVMRQFDLIRDRIQVAKFGDTITAHAASLGVDCPSVPVMWKQDRQHGRETMEAYTQALLRISSLRDARITLKYFHVIEPKTKGATKKPKVEKPTLVRNVSWSKARPTSPPGGRFS